MKNSKVIKFVSASLIVVLLLGISILRFYNLNNYYPDFKIVEHSIGERITGGDISITVLSYKLLNGKQTKDIAPDYIIEAYNNDGTIPQDEQIRNLLIYLKVENNSDSQKTVSFVDFTPESYAWKNGLSLELYTLLNPDAGSPLTFYIEPKSNAEVILPYTMIYSQFEDDDWERIEQREFDLVLSQYPTKHIVNLY